MKEKDLASEFKQMFIRYHPQVIVNKAEPGWPDRMLQHNSTAVFVELKRITPNKDGTFYTGLRQDQGAWLAKWQRNHGKCFMFLGLNDMYGILTQPFWSIWIDVPKIKYTTEKLTLVTLSSHTVLEWFKGYLAS